MNTNAMSGIIGAVTDMLDGDNNTKPAVAGMNAKSQNGFSLLQPILQNFMNEQPGDNGKVEDMDDDGIMGVITSLTKNVDLGSLLKHMDKDQISDITEFVQEKFIGSSDDKKADNAQGLGNIMNSLQAMDIDTGDLVDTFGTLVKAFKK